MSTIKEGYRTLRLPSASPEAHLADGQRLQLMEPELGTRAIRDVVIVKNGRLVWRWHDRGSDRIAAVYSCTKSIVSALVGIAVDDGLLKLDTPIAQYFEWLYDDQDERKSAITVRQLLTMTPGLAWPEFDKPYFRMRRTSDWVGFITKQPISHPPGQTFAYNSGCSHLLSAILTQLYGEPAQLLAERRLFTKLGCRAIRWPRHGGISEGGAGLQMAAEDLAKFGLLYLQKGQWEGEQLLSRDWIEQSTAVQSRGMPQYQPSIYGEYGYHWWVSSASHNGCCDFYFALGYGGQYLFVVPELELVAVIRKAVQGKGKAMLAKELLLDYIIPAAGHAP